MLQTNTTTYQIGRPLRPLGTPSAMGVRPDEHIEVRREQQQELAMDDALAASFPASDPPAWNPGVARPIPIADTTRNRASGIPRSTKRESAVSTPGVIDLSRPYGAERTLLQALTSVLGAVGLALLVPLAILLVGLPIVLAVRGLVELVAWLFRAISG
jgi:hypothetical protein